MEGGIYKNTHVTQQRYVSPVMYYSTSKITSQGKRVDSEPVQTCSTNAMIYFHNTFQTIGNYSCRHYPGGHWSRAHFFLDHLVLANFHTAVVYRVIDIDDFDSLALVL